MACDGLLPASHMLRPIVTAIAILALCAPALAAPARVVTEAVVPLPPAGVGAGMCAQGLQPMNVGYACFETRPGETHVTVSVTDPVAGAYGGFYQFLLAGGDSTPFSTYCGGGFDADLPAGARAVRVSPGKSLQDAECPGSGTLSDVTVTFT